MYKSLSVPFLGWVSFQTLYRGGANGDCDAPYWTPTIHRGRTRELVIRIPLRWWAVTFNGRGKRYVELVDAPHFMRHAGGWDWLVDEFDASFNAIAIASLKYHMDYAVTWCSPKHRAIYTDLIERLSEPHPRVYDNDEERAVFEATGLFTQFETSPEKRALFERYRQRETDWNQRQLQARHDFVDIMRGLWS